MTDEVKMDSRCARRMTTFPQHYCPLAVLRLKNLRYAGRELTEEEEAQLPGCPYSITHQLSNFCFFKYMAHYYPNKPLVDIEIAHFNSISIESVKKITTNSIAKMRQLDDFLEISDFYNDKDVFSDT